MIERREQRARYLWPAFERYTARAMASQLAGVFERAIRQREHGVP